MFVYKYLVGKCLIEAWRIDSLDLWKNTQIDYYILCSSIQLVRVRGFCIYTQFSISLTIKTEQIICGQKKYCQMRV